MMSNVTQWNQIATLMLAKVTIGLLLSTTSLFLSSTSSVAQVVVTPSSDGTGTQVTNPSNTQFEIQGGTISGQNLFHHFDRFNPQNQNVNFNVPNTSIQNILSRVSGGDVSYINGLLKVTGGNANLFLINPAGIIFGNNASLNVPASFTATTATRVKIGDNWLNSIGLNDYNSLLGTPSEFAFGTTNPGVIINNGNLAVNAGNSLSLIGGVVANTGTLSAPSGQILLQAVPGSSKVQMNLPGSPLILEFEGNDLPANITPQSLPQLLTGSIPIQGLQAEGDKVRLTASDRLASAAPGSAIVGGLLDLLGPGSQPESITISGHSILLAPNPRLNDKDELYHSINVQSQVRILSSGNVDIFGGIINHHNKKPFIRGEEDQSLGILIRAKGNINISNCLEASVCLESFGGKDVKLISENGNIITDGFTINTSGNGITLSPSGSIVLDAYGDIRTQNLWSRDEGDPTIPSALLGIQVISKTGSVDLRGGFLDTGNSQQGKSPFSNRSAPITIMSAKDVYTGEIDISSGQQGSLLTIISKTGNIDTTAGSLYAFSNGGSANINISAPNGNVALAEVRANGTSNGGSIQIEAQNLNVTKTLQVGSPSGDPGTLTLDVSNSIQLPQEVYLNRANLISSKPLTSLATSANGSIINTGGGSISLDFASDYTLPANLTLFTNGGDIRITGAGALAISSDLNTSSPTANGGSIFLQSGSTLATQNLTTTGANNGGNVSLIAPISISTGNINTSGTNGNGGNVLLDPQLSVQAGWINTQGGPNGTGGNVDIVSIQDFVRLTGSFQASNGIDASISTIGGLGGGSITITHNGGDLFIPFNVTRLRDNGSQAAFTTGSETILNGIFPGPYRQGNIALITSPRFANALADALPDGNLRDALELDMGGTLFPLEEKFTREFSKDAKVLSLEEMQSTLRKVEDNTGTKPALIYVSYASVPASMPDDCKPGELVDDKLNPGKKKECSCKDVVMPSEHYYSAQSVIQYEPLPCDRLTLTLVTSSGAPIYIPLSKASRYQVNNAAEAFRNSVAGKQSRKDPRLVENSRTLYNWLVPPQMQTVLRDKGISNLSYLFPDAYLRLIPVSAVLDEQGKFLIETYSTGLMPSLSLVDTREVEVKRSSVLALGLSEFSPEQEQSPLPYATEEIAKIPSPWSTIRKQNEEVTFQKIQKSDPPGIVHFATHGAFSKEFPEGIIQLWNQKIIPREMKELNWFDPKIPPIELMILSACKTAYGDDASELGFAGSAHYFGVKSVLGSLWNVSDQSTSELMEEFYKYLREKPTKADALAEAQKLFIHNYEPFHWSAFTLIGNPW